MPGGPLLDSRTVSRHGTSGWRRRCGGAVDAVDEQVEHGAGQGLQVVGDRGEGRVVEAALGDVLGDEGDRPDPARHRRLGLQPTGADGGRLGQPRRHAGPRAVRSQDATQDAGESWGYGDRVRDEEEFYSRAEGLTRVLDGERIRRIFSGPVAYEE